MATDSPTHRWQVTVRAADDSASVETALRETIVPLVAADPAASNIGLAACLNCAGEFTFMADWSGADRVTAFEGTDAYRSALGALEPQLRVPPKRELWRLLG